MADAPQASEEAGRGPCRHTDAGGWLGAEEQQTLAGSGIDLQEPPCVSVPNQSWTSADTESRSGTNMLLRRNEARRLWSDWFGDIHETELAKTWSPEAVVRQEPQVTVTVVLLSGRSAEVSATDSTVLRQIREVAGSKLGVRIARLLRADGSAIDEWQTLAESAWVQEPLQALVCTGEIMVGSWVRVREAVPTPVYGWGAIRHGDFGRVQAINGETVTVDFERQEGWVGELNEMDLWC